MHLSIQRQLGLWYSIGMSQKNRLNLSGILQVNKGNYSTADIQIHS